MTKLFTIFDERVCKNFFLKVIQINNKRSDYAYKKKIVSRLSKHDKKRRKTPPKLPHIPRKGRDEEAQDKEMLPAEYGDDYN